MAALASSAEIISKAQEIGARLNLPPAVFANIDQPNDLAAPFIEIDRAYHYVIRERDKELSRKSTMDIDELLYWIFEGVTFGLSSKYELYHRDETRDFRRVMFDRQLRLLGAIKLEWRMRCADKFNEILAQHPFTDSGPPGLS